jgi:hypothetical protein
MRLKNKIITDYVENLSYIITPKYTFVVFSTETFTLKQLQRKMAKARMQEGSFRQIISLSNISFCTFHFHSIYQEVKFPTKTNI